MYAKPFNVHTPTVRGTVSSLPSIFRFEVHPFRAISQRSLPPGSML